MMGAAAGSDVNFDGIQQFYQTGNPDKAFPLLSDDQQEGAESLNHRLASWSIRHRDVEARDLMSFTVSCTESRHVIVVYNVLKILLLCLDEPFPCTPKVWMQSNT